MFFTFTVEKLSGRFPDPAGIVSRFLQPVTELDPEQDVQLSVKQQGSKWWRVCLEFSWPLKFKICARNCDVQTAETNAYLLACDTLNVSWKLKWGRCWWNRPRGGGPHSYIATISCTGTGPKLPPNHWSAELKMVGLPLNRQLEEGNITTTVIKDYTEKVLQTSNADYACKLHVTI